MANIDDAFTVDTLSLDDNVLITSGILDPTIGGGYEAPIGSLFLKTDGRIFQKFDTADVDWTRLSIGLDNILENTFEPTGITNRVDSTVGFVNGTRTYTIQPAVTEFTYFIKGTEYTVTAPKSIVIPDVSGTVYIYLDAALNINTTATFTYDLLSIYAYAGAIYWNSLTQEAVYVGDERHGITMDGITHIHLHTSFGTQYVNGLGFSNMIVDGDGSLDSHTQLDVDDGIIRDEDLQHDIVDNAPQQLTGIAQIPVLYKFGTNDVWHVKPADNSPFIQDGTAGFIGTGLPAFNELVGNDWQLNEVANNKYFFMHYLATNDIYNPIVGILGINEYQNKPQGQEAASLEFNSLTGLPFQEYTPLATVIFEAKSAYTNTVKATIASTSDGYDFIDWKSAINTFNLGGGGAATGVDELTKVSANDLDAGYLNGKLVNGASLTFTENNDGGSETLTIDTTIPLADIQTEIDNIELASGGIYTTLGVYDGTAVDLAINGVTASTDLLDALSQMGSNVSTLQLNDLTDVTLATPLDGQTMVYNTTTSQWENVTTTVNTPGVGRLLQVKFNVINALSGTNTVPVTINDPLITDGIELWSETLTPAEITSNMRISTSSTVSGSSNNTEMMFAFFRDTTCIGVGLVNMSARNAGHPFVITVYDTPAVLTPLVYSCRVGKTTGNTWYINRLDDATLLNGQLANQAYTVEEIGVNP